MEVVKKEVLRNFLSYNELQLVDKTSLKLGAEIEEDLFDSDRERERDRQTDGPIQRHIETDKG
jgi:hypothetical protein